MGRHSGCFHFALYPSETTLCPKSLCFFASLYASRRRWPRGSCLSFAPEEAEATQRLLEKAALEPPITAKGSTEPELAGKEAGCILSHLPSGTLGKAHEAGNMGLVQVFPGAASPRVEPWNRPTEGRVSTAGTGGWEGGQAAGTLLFLLSCNLQEPRPQTENWAQKGARGGRRASGLRWRDPLTVSPRPHTRMSWLLSPDEL